MPEKEQWANSCLDKPICPSMRGDKFWSNEKLPKIGKKTSGKYKDQLKLEILRLLKYDKILFKEHPELEDKPQVFLL